MLYIFGSGHDVRIVHGSRLTEEEKLEAVLVVETLPIPEDQPEGHYPDSYYIDPVTKKFGYVYKPLSALEKIEEEE